MGRIEELVEHYGKHIALPWERGVAGAQRVVMVVYDKELERMLKGRREMFATATAAAGHDWHAFDLATIFADWMADAEFRDAYFESPEDLSMKLEAEFVEYVAARIRAAITASDITDSSTFALFGIGSLFGFARVSQLLREIERDIRGQLIVFFPGQFYENNYRLLDARDGWNYLAVPITAAGNQFMR